MITGPIAPSCLCNKDCLGQAVMSEHQLPFKIGTNEEDRHNEIITLSFFTDCSEDLGLESGNIPDIAITSSPVSMSDFGPEKSRLNSISSWGSRDPVSGNPWIQVCFDSFKSVTGIVLQGPGSISYSRVTKFMLSYDYGLGNSPHQYQINGRNVVSYLMFRF